jgi:Trypsin-like peptidase domain
VRRVLSTIGLFIATVTAIVSVADTPHVTAPTTTQSSAVTIDQLQSEIADLKKKIDKPPKDAWDKATALSGLSSGILVALIGFYATNIYNKRQKVSEERRKDQEILISQIQTVEKFIPHLASDNEQSKGAALIAIAALGNEELAVRLASAFKGSGATRALTEIAATGGNTQARRDAKLALLDVLAGLKSRVVALYAKGIRRATGFIVSTNGLIITTAHAVIDDDPTQFQVKLPSGQMSSVSVVNVDESLDLALLKADTEKRLTALDLSPAVPLLGANVVAMLIDLEGRFQVRLGTVVGVTGGADQIFGKGVQHIEVDLSVEPGASGTPVVDSEGRLLGLVQATVRMSGEIVDRTAYLIPAEAAIAFVNHG